MKCYSYKIEHDYGLAPNPFHGYCTLAVCKSQIRKNRNLEIGDWIVGMGSKALKNDKTLIFAMCLEEKLTFNEYWNDERFVNKKPVINGSLVQMYGDNFYHQENGEWIQENSAHSLKNGKINIKHCNRDISGQYVLISKFFYYFGNNPIKIPNEYSDIYPSRGMQYLKNENIKNEFIYWLININTKNIGIHGDPISWNENTTEKDKKKWDEYLQWEKEMEANK